MTRRLPCIVYATLLLQASLAAAQGILSICQQLSNAISRDSDVFYNRASISPLAFSIDSRDMQSST